jgi:hypothetical protein
MNDTADTKSEKSKPTTNLRTWNFWLAGLHALQGVIILILGVTRGFPVTVNYLTKDVLASAVAGPGHMVLSSATRLLFNLNLTLLVAAFFFMSAIAHLVIATVYRSRYEENLKQGINKARWIEYGFSASTMMVAIAMLTGISDIATLLLIFMATMVMNLMGLAMEVYNQKAKQTNWLAYVIGCIAGLVPWVAIGLSLWGAVMYGEGGIPGFVYAIYISMFVLFNSFAINMLLQYRKRGKWASYLYGERMYMILSLVAKTALAWQVFAGALRP